MRKIAVFIILLLIFIPIASADPFTDWFRGLFGITGNAVICKGTTHLESGKCVSNSKTCTASCTNGVGKSGTQTWNGKAYGACSATTCASCKSGFKLSGVVCLASCTPNCNKKNCGASDGCGGYCGGGSCKNSPQTCGGGGTPNVCGCTAAAKATVAAACAKNGCGASDGCGGYCGKGICPAPQTCSAVTPNICGCTATAKVSAVAACKNKACGVPDGCGGYCGKGICSAPQTCGGGGSPNVCGCKETSYTPDLKTFCGTKNVLTNCKTTVSKTGTLTCTSSQVCTNNACVQEKKTASSAALAGGRVGFGDVLGALVPNVEWKYWGDDARGHPWTYPSFSWPVLFGGGPAPVEPYAPASVRDPSNPSSTGVESNRDPCQETCGRGPKGKVAGIYDPIKCKDCDDRFRRVGY